MEEQNRQIEIFDLLNVNLKLFEGPLELLLDLIRKKRMDIQEIPLAEICEPYLEHLELMREFNLEIAIEFLDIASTLILIKSRALLPREPDELDEEDGLETEEQLRERLIEYQRFKLISETLYQRPLLGRDVFARPEVVEEDQDESTDTFEDLSIYSLIQAYRGIIKKRGYHKSHEVTQDEFSLEQRILDLMKIFQSGKTLDFQEVCPRDPTQSEVIITFMAILELGRLFLIQLHQMREFGPIHCKPNDRKIVEAIPEYEAQMPNAS